MSKLIQNETLQQDQQKSVRCGAKLALVSFEQKKSGATAVMALAIKATLMNSMV